MGENKNPAIEEKEVDSPDIDREAEQSVASGESGNKAQNAAKTQVNAAENTSEPPAANLENSDEKPTEDKESPTETSDGEVNNYSEPNCQSEGAEGASEQFVQTETVKEEQVKPAKKKRGKQIFWNIFLIAIIGLGIYSMFGILNEINPEESAPFGEVFGNASPLFCCVLVAVILLIMAADTAKFCIINKTVTGKVRFVAALKTNFIGRYYDAVTPFSTGGQPMQIYYLNSKGISGGNSSAIVFIKYFSTIICWMLIGSALMIWGTAAGILDNLPQGNLLKITGWIGIAVNLVIPIFVTMFLIMPKLMHKLTVGVVNLGHKMKIVKDTEKGIKRATKIVDDFKSSFKVMATSPVRLILLILLCCLESVLTFSVPFFVMKALNCNVDSMFFTVMALNVFATFGASFIPTPGNSGVVETLGGLAFSVVASATAAWAVLVWRLSVFYLYIVIGLGITVYDMVKKNVKSKKQLPAKK